MGLRGACGRASWLRPGGSVLAGLGVTIATCAAVGCGSSGTTDDPDAAVDAAPPDQDSTTPPLDASKDGAAPADAAIDAFLPAQPFCATVTPTPKFCDDFDDGDLKNDWDAFTVIAGTSLIDLDGTVSTSQPYSFVAQSKAITDTSSGNASLRKTIPGTVNHVVYSFSALFQSTTFDKGVVAIATVDVSMTHYFTLNLRDDGTTPAATLEEFVNGTIVRHALTKLPPANVWTRVVVDLDFGGGKASVSFGADKALDADTITPTPGTEATIRLGGVYINGPSDAFQANFDDVVLDF